MRQPKCPKCKMSSSLDLIGKVVSCGFCHHQWKPPISVRDRIEEQKRENEYRRKAKEERVKLKSFFAGSHKPIPERKSDGWLVRTSGGYHIDELDLSLLSVEEQIANRDALTVHLNSLIEHGFVDGTLEPQHLDYCYLVSDDDTTLGTCDIDCPVIEAERNSTYRANTQQYELF